ncbi:FAD-binding oxidoreductase [Sulfuracidifex tepidarius]|uniref:D-lactate dehydrogenase n=1 Tax=Sulfuracidifex tepidarius TaxID=1294262 RepID=A0A510E4M4_9CREN|nr:FAD-linked oxidase C-terminal domain-containing protein [Sulfuracidifex tepidarius]BBG27461.1 D-lactate dehydrogenase [Sulfuracidifex tepidarius]
MTLEKELKEIVGDKWVMAGEESSLFSIDGFTAYRGNPSMVVLPGNEEETVRVVRSIIKHGEKIIFRGSGTSLSGGSIPVDGEIVVGLSRLNRIEEYRGNEVIVGPGIANIMLTKNAPPHLFYAPDPASYSVSSIGGNISHDSGGIHVIKYGPTFNSVLGVKTILPDGNVEDLLFHNGQLNPSSIFIGAEGTLGAIVKARLKLFPKPESRVSVFATFNTVIDAGKAVVEVFRRGIIPSALELMDRNIIYAIERSRYKADLPDVSAMLLVELDGSTSQVTEEKAVTESAIEANNGKVIDPKGKENQFWNARKGAFPSMGAISPAYITLDCTVPRSALPRALESIEKISKEEKVFIANVFHAGDGNLHPLIPYDPNVKESLLNALKVGEKISKIAITMGGVPSGEHGIGIEKIRIEEIYYNEEEIAVIKRIKQTFDPNNLFNPWKIFRPVRLPKQDEVLKVMWEWE